MTNSMPRVSAPVLLTSLNMSYSESTAVFKKRCLEIGLTEANYTAFKDEGLETLGTFAFACNYSPGNSDDRPLVNLVTKVFGAAPSTKEMACVRRLHSEAYATIAADIRAKVETSDETMVKKLAPAERSQRLRDQQAKLTGLDLRGNCEPGDSLVDRCVSAYESDRISYLPWEACVSRDHEILTGSKKDTSLSFDASGNLKLAKRDQVEPCSASNEIQVRYCLLRRGLALDQANILDYKKHDKLVEKLMSVRMEEPPPGCMKISMKQIEIADKKFWTLMAEKTREGIKAGPSGRPCDNEFNGCMNSPEFLNLLQHRFATSNVSGSPPAPRSSDGPKNKRSKTEANNGPKGNGKGFMRIPSELLSLGCVGATPKGQRLCFDFNLKRCKLQAKDQRCQKGLHLCAVKGCQKSHAAKDCPTKGGAGNE